MPDVSESPDLLCLLAMPRTGSSYVSDLFDAHPQFQSHTELFHREAVFLRVADRSALLPDLTRLARTRSADIYDPALVAWARKSPRALLDFLSERREKRFLTFKVFPRHLSDEQLDPVLFDAPRIACLLLERDPLASYVSQLKARRTREFSHRDTSHLTVDAEAAEFVDDAAPPGCPRQRPDRFHQPLARADVDARILEPGDLRREIGCTVLVRPCIDDGKARLLQPGNHHAADGVAIGIIGQQNPDLLVGRQLAPLIRVKLGKVRRTEGEVIGPLERRRLARLGAAAEPALQEGRSALGAACRPRRPEIAK